MRTTFRTASATDASSVTSHRTANRFGALLLELLHDVLEPVFASARHGHRRAFIGESQRQRAADPTAPAGDPNDLVVETLGHALRVAAPRRAATGGDRYSGGRSAGSSRRRARVGEPSVSRRKPGRTRAARSTSSR